jgi:hypothetical protein
MRATRPPSRHTLILCAGFVVLPALAALSVANAGGKSVAAGTGVGGTGKVLTIGVGGTGKVNIGVGGTGKVNGVGGSG